MSGNTGSPPAEHPTARRLLDAAEALFAEHGYEGTTVRQVLERAGIGNGAAVSYHFGSKDDLYAAVLRRLQEPISRARTAALAGLRRRAGPPDVEELVRAFVAPVLELRHTAPGLVSSRVLAHQLGRLGTRSWAVALTAVTEVVDEFELAFREALPHLTPEQTSWRLRAMGGLLMTVELGLTADLAPGGGDELVRFLAAGWRA